jgi:hypothetical protein
MAIVLEYATERRHRRWVSRRTVRRVVVAMLLLMVATFVAADLGMFDDGGERECLIWPTIDTRFAKGYSESAFNRIRIGMTREQVDRIMCAPLFAEVYTKPEPLLPSIGTWLGVDPASPSVLPAWLHEVPSGAASYRYTCDGAAPWGDFAWQRREVFFEDGRVTAVFRHAAPY